MSDRQACDWPKGWSRCVRTEPLCGDESAEADESAHKHRELDVPAEIVRTHDGKCQQQ